MTYSSVPDHTGQSFPASPQYATVPGTAVGVPESPQYETVPEAGDAVTPATIFSGLIDWFDGDLDVDVVGGTWTGQKAGHVCTAINSPAYSATLLNGHGGFSFIRASAQRFENATLELPLAPFTIVLVARQNAWNSGGTLFAAAAGASRVFQLTATPQIAMNNGANANNNGNLALATWGVVVAEFTNSTSDRNRAGGVDVTGANAGNADPPVGFQVAASAGASHCSCSIVQVLAITGTPDAGEYTAYAAYVLSRYGVTL